MHSTLLLQLLRADCSENGHPILPSSASQDCTGQRGPGAGKDQVMLRCPFLCTSDSDQNLFLQSDSFTCSLAIWIKEVFSIGIVISRLFFVLQFLFLPWDQQEKKLLFSWETILGLLPWHHISNSLKCKNMIDKMNKQVNMKTCSRLSFESPTNSQISLILSLSY